jgi:hypothetical protein
MVKSCNKSINSTKQLRKLKIIYIVLNISILYNKIEAIYYNKQKRKKLKY